MEEKEREREGKVLFIVVGEMGVCFLNMPRQSYRPAATRILIYQHGTA